MTWRPFAIWVNLAVDLATDYLERLRQRPVFLPMTPDERQELLSAMLSEEGIAPEELLTSIQDHIFTHPMGKLDPKVAPLFAGLERAQSVAVDPHKWLSVPVECGCALVHDKYLLRETFSLVPPYLQLEEGEGFASLPWFSEYGFQQTRGFRALKVWMVLQSAGRQGLVQRIRRHNALAQHLASLVDSASDFERLAPVSLSIVCFRYIPQILKGDEAGIERTNRALAPLVQSSGETFLTSTMLHGQFALRACILHDATTEEDVEALLASVRRAGETRTR